MPKSTSKSKNRKNKNKNTINVHKQLLILKDDMQEYAKVTKMLGNCRIMVILPDNCEFMAIIPGKFRRNKKYFISIGDIILVNKREYQDDKLDVSYKYNNTEAMKLNEMNEIPNFFLESDVFSSIVSINDNFQFVADDDDDERIEVAYI